MRHVILTALLIFILDGAHAGELDRLTWLAGHWATVDGAAEEGWFAPKNGAMPGQFRWVFPDGGQVLEFLVIEEDERGVWLRFKHFSTDYEPWEKDAPLLYRLAEVSHQHATFEREPGQEGGFQTMRYERDGDRLSVSGEGAEDGSRLRLDYHRYRTPAHPAPPPSPAAADRPPGAGADASEEAGR